MNLKDKNIVFGLTGSFCTLKNTILQIKELVKDNANVLPIMSNEAYKTDTKYGKASEFRKELQKITGNKVLHTITDVELIGKKMVKDIMIIAPCTGNTIAKLSVGICDSSVLMAVKFHLRSDRPIVIAPSAVDGLSRKC